MDPHQSEPVILKVFVSSPGDLVSTRARVQAVIEKMSGRVIEGRKVEFRPMLYENHTAAVVGYSPQQAVDYYTGCAGEMDIYLGMFWSRLGSPVIIRGRKHPSGTRYEFESAYRGLRNCGMPRMLLYRCRRPVAAEADAAQLEEVEAFFGGFKGLHPQYDGFPQDFAGDDDLEVLLARDLDQLARQIIHGSAPGARSAVQTHELAELVGSVRTWLSSFEDMFGKDLKEDQERERDRLFPVHFKTLPGHEEKGGGEAYEVVPGVNESLLDVFDRWGHRVLMVGERGTGKTFAMLRLMQDLADRAHLHPGEPVPVFFNLSSWSETYRESMRRAPMFVRFMQWLFPQPKRTANTLDQWLEDQMVRNYSMQRRAAQKLLGSNSVIICLDGLDELGAVMLADGGGEASERASRELREACVRAINGTLGNLSTRMVLCCREHTYHELAEKPAMGRPLRTQLLTSAEVFEGLRHWPKLEGLRQAMEQSPVLVERARIALFLGMMRVAFQGMDKERILQASALPRMEWEKHLMDHYVDQCMRLAPPESQALNKELVPNCLAWMAQMPDNDFLLDDLQPSVLRMEGTLEGVESWRQYRRLSVMLLALSLMLVETIPPGIALAVEYYHLQGWRQAVHYCLLMWGLSALILTPLYLAAFAARHWLQFGFCFGLAWAIDSSTCIYLASNGWNEPSDGTFEGAKHMFLTSLPCACLFFMLMGMQFIGRVEEHKRRYSTRPGIEWHEIQPVEPMSWCWFDSNAYWRGGWIGLVIGPVVLLIAMLAGEGMRGTVAGILITILVTMFSGLSGTGVARVSIEPNQGIARSLRHAVLMTRIFVVFGVLAWGGVYYARKADWAHGLAGASMGLTLGFAFYVFGGWPVIQQFCLGMVLNRERRLPSWWCWPPWRSTVQFLDDLVRYKLLRHTAGGYMFRHQSLRDYYRSHAGGRPDSG